MSMSNLFRYVCILALSGLIFVIPVHSVYGATCAEGASTGLCNPLAVSTVAEFVALALQVMVKIALPIIAVFMVLAGFYFVSARGNPGKLEIARRNFLWVVIGAVLILGAWVVANLIAGTIKQVLGS